MPETMGGHGGLVTALVRSSFLVSSVYAEVAREYKLTPQQGQLLCVLMGQPYGMGELSATLRLAKSSLTELVDRTTMRGLVRREPDPRDGRAIRVVLTRRGGELAGAFYTAARHRLDALTEDLTPDQRAALADLLGLLVTHNDVPMVFMEPDAPTAARQAGPR
ncbi:MarR family transcriptional regulator [Sphaerisporangium album]|uniref:MarR family transcriptional regulator n=1 Tax=Sphaerisporangium album TaxID=509200 RepID=A0A367FFE9_9ACTN|nr:MarR family transcriptional regulator [Sphaerisporangium album]RCG28552.1 MarR family transcriptional regulator [Sphaerisporangium album]